MTVIDVRCEAATSGWRCAVRVTEPNGASAYDVTVRDARSFLPPDAPAPVPSDIDNLVRETFSFLLEREPRTAILPAFDLSVVARYYPDYPATIRERPHA
jgi:hypothetical protein